MIGVHDKSTGDSSERDSSGAPGASAPAVHDEAVRSDGQPRDDYADLLARIDAIDTDDLHQRWQAASDGLYELGVTLRSEDGEKPYPIDLVPRIVSADRWAELSIGLEQRCRAVDAFLQDVYGPQEIVSAGIISESTIRRAPGYTESGRAVPAGVVRAGVCGVDLVSPESGEWLILEDNVRMPGGIAMADTNRSVLQHHFPELMPPAEALLDPNDAYTLLGEALRRCTPGGGASDASVVMVSPGPSDSTWYEQSVIAERNGVPLVTADQLAVNSDGVFWVADSGERHRVDVINPRMDMEDVLDATGADGQALRAGLLAAITEGQVTVVNAPGNGVGDDKAIYPYVPQMIEFYLGEKPLIGQVPTFLCADPVHREQVLDRIAELVVKPIDGYGGSGILVGHEASPVELDTRRKEIQDRPEHYVAQEVVPLSTLPALVDGSLQSSHVDLRAFVVQYSDGHGGIVSKTLPTALSRVAPAGTMVVNVSSGGGGKDTWIYRD